MTHSDIYTKFMIEYDKANVTSSYPSLTPYEIATLLDKAYLALIAQKFTGNNFRQALFEQDTKAVEDLQPLVVTKVLATPTHNPFINNQYDYNRPSDVLYYIQGLLMTDKATNAIDREAHVALPVHLISHQQANRFFATNNNLPWIPEPVVYEESNKFNVLVDSYKLLRPLESLDFRITYIKYPAKFALTSSSSSDIDTPTNPVNTEELWYINPISGINAVYNTNNYSSFTTSSYSNKQNTSTVTFSISEGSKYATITTSGKLTVLSTAVTYSSVTIKATCDNDPSVSTSTTIRVKYYLQTNTSSSTGGSSGDDSSNTGNNSDNTGGNDSGNTGNNNNSGNTDTGGDSGSDTSNLVFTPILQSYTNQSQQTIGRGRGVGLPVWTGMNIYTTDGSGKQTLVRHLNEDDVANYMRENYYSDYVWDITYSNVVVNSAYTHHNNKINDTQSTHFRKFVGGSDWYGTVDNINYASDTIGLVYIPTMYEVYSNPSLYGSVLVDPYNQSKNPDDYVIHQGRNSDWYYMNLGIYIADSITYDVTLTYGPANDTQTVTTNITTGIDVSCDNALAMAVGVLRGVSWDTFITDPQTYINQLAEANAFTKYYAVEDASSIQDQEANSFARGEMLDSNTNIETGEIFVMLRKDESFQYNACVLALQFDGHPSTIVPGNDGMPALVEMLGLTSWVNNQNISGRGLLVEGGKNYYEDGTHRILNEDGTRKYFSIPYEDSVTTFDGQQYRRYGGPDYLITAFEASSDLTIVNFEFFNANTFNLI